MKIVIDDKIPYIKGVFEPFAEVIYLPGDLTTAEVVKDADVLVTRTRTQCDKDLLRGSSVKFIATATIGFDHIDTRYCEAAGIQWKNAPGCNAESVNQYISSALFSYSSRNGIDLTSKTIGIVGVGQVGSRVAKTCEVLGMKVLLNDPPRERREGPAQFVSLEAIRQQADIISFHVPLNRGGRDNTFHMVNGEFFRNLGRNPLLINTSRGEIFETETVKGAIDAGVISGLIVDCWENEPGLDLNLLERVDYGTPHIAGYSRDGKSNGTRASVRAISKYFDLGMDNWEPTDVERPGNPLIDLRGNYQSEQSLISDAVLSTYQIANDDRALRDNPHIFEKLRGDYPVRREFSFYSIKAGTIEFETLEKLRKLGFKII